MKPTRREDIFGFLEKYSGKDASEISLFEDIVKEWEINGDEGEHFVKMFSERFDVDMSGFNFYKHFDDEGDMLTMWLVKTVPIFFVSAALSIWQIDSVQHAKALSDTSHMNGILNLFPFTYLFSHFVYATGLNPSDFAVWAVFVAFNVPAAYFGVKLFADLFSKKKRKKTILVRDLLRIAENQKWDL